MTHMRALERHIERVLVMGIVNRTPDSFFDGGHYLDDNAARVRIAQLLCEGADIVDVGAESTRPGAKRLDASEQLKRLGNVFELIAESGGIGSVDTTLPEVAAQALQQGARYINSVSLERADELGAVAASFDATLILTHSRGPMSDMTGFSQYAADGYGDVVEEVLQEWHAAATQATKAGLPAERVVFDPGLGFAKNAQQSLELCARLNELREGLGAHPILIGASRKSYIAHSIAQQEGVSAATPDQRLGGSIAAALYCADQGAAIVRVHDVAETVQALAYRRCLQRAAGAPSETAGGVARA
jgi:dihydropteroate synthase